MAGAALVAGVAMAPSAAEAQDFTSGAVAISVKDANGAPVAGATVTLTSQAQGITKTLTTSAGGSATATGLAPGDYTVSVSANGFDTYSGTASVVVSQEVTYTYALNTTGASTTVVVKGKRVRQDFNKTTAGLSVDLTTLTSQQAIGRNIQSVILLAPTTVNSTAFGQPSIGGGSAAENAYYVNGLNITNPDTFVGGAGVPFDFYKTIDTQTSGYAAEFGRATGGVVNATTKSGTNDFMFAVHGNFAPQSLRSTVFAADDTTSPAKFNKSDLNSLSVESGGALVKDKLFLYGLVQFSDNNSQFASTTGRYLEKDKSNDPFYGLKADWYITPGQHLELTYFDTTSTTKEMRYAYTGSASDGSDGVVGAKIGPAVAKTGGPSYIAKYTGNVTDWLTISAAYGDSKNANDFNSADPNDPYVITYDPTQGRFLKTPGLKQPYSAAATKDDWERKFYRGDADIRFEAAGRHHVRFGFDHEDVSMDKVTQLPGTLPIRYYLLPSYGYGYIVYEHLGGHVSGKASSYYIQDSWDVSSTLNLQLGLRNDDFKENNLSNQQFLSLTGNIAPRLGLSWKPSDDSKWRFTASYGQYFIPPAMNLGFRGKDTYFREFFNMPAGGYVIGADGLPASMGTVRHHGSVPCPTVDFSQSPIALDGSPTTCSVFGGGNQEPAFAKAAVGLKATRESEITLGAYYRASDLWSFDAVYVNRNLDRVSEDTDFAPQINAYCATKGYTCSYSNEYHVWNVGDSVTINTFSTLPDGTKQLTLTGLGFPKPKRKYEALTFDFKRAFDGKWGLQGSYTYSRSTGNYEGTVLTIGDGTAQSDAGSTELYDYVHLSDYSDGVLPNDRDHEFKVWGEYALTPNLMVGANVQIISPAYLSCLGTYPDENDVASAYGAVSHYCYSGSGATTTPSPMGHGGKTDWTKTIDMHVAYTLPDSWSLGGKLVLRADVFNLFNDKEVTYKDTVSDNGFNPCFQSSDPQCAGNTTNLMIPNSHFGSPISYNTARYMRIGFDLQY